MDLSVLDEKPPGRQPVETAVLPAGRVPEVIEHLRGALAEGRQAYWVCPLVEESEVLDLQAAVARQLQDGFAGDAFQDAAREFRGDDAGIRT